LILPFEYDYLRHLSKDQFLFGVRGKYTGDRQLGVVDINNTKIVPPLYNNIRKYRKRYFVSQNHHKTLAKTEKDVLRETYSKEGLLDQKGNILMPVIYDNIEVTNDSLIIATLNKKVALFDLSGKALTGFDYEIIWSLSKNWLWAKNLRGKHGFLNQKGEKVIPFKYEDARPFFDSVAVVKNHGKWGIISAKNKVLVPFTFDSIGLPNQGQFAGKKMQHWGMYDFDGREILPSVYDSISGHPLGILGLKKQHQWYIYDYKNRQILPESFDVFKLDYHFHNNSTLIDYRFFDPTWRHYSFGIAQKNGMWYLFDGNATLRAGPASGYQSVLTPIYPLVSEKEVRDRAQVLSHYIDLETP
jgi:hypothetical protein